MKTLEHAGIPLVAQTASDERLPGLLGAFPADILLLDFEPCDGEPASQLAALHLASPATAILLAIDVMNGTLVEPALLQGVRGFVAKADNNELAKAIAAVLDGEIWLSRSQLSRALLKLIAQHTAHARTQTAARPDESLSPREREIVHLIARGWTNKEIARLLGISDKTIKAHVSHVLARLGLSRRTQITGHPRSSASRPSAKTPPKRAA